MVYSLKSEGERVRLTFCIAHTNSARLNWSITEVFRACDSCSDVIVIFLAFVQDFKIQSPNPNSAISGRWTSLYARLRSRSCRSAARTSFALAWDSTCSCEQLNQERKSGSMVDKIDTKRIPRWDTPRVSDIIR